MKKAKLDKVLKALMKASGMKASDLSKATGIPAATLSSLLNGGQTHKPEHLLSLSQHFKVSIEFLLFGEDDRRPTLDEVLTEGVFSGWLKVEIKRAIPDKRKVGSDDELRWFPSRTGQAIRDLSDGGFHGTAVPTLDGKAQS